MAIYGFWRGPSGSGGGGDYDDTAINARVAAVEAEVDTLQTDVAGLPDPYDDTALIGRVTAVEGEVDALQVADTTLSGRVTQAEAGITQLEADVAAIPEPYDDTALSGRVTALENEPAPSWGDVTGKPTTFAPEAHSHPIADVTGLQAVLDDKLDADRLVSLTQAEYDALGTPDPETFYFISG